MNRPVLRHGDRGAAVETLQRYLRSLGYPAAATGVYDAATEAAVRAYQRDCGLVPTGATGEDVWAALEYAGPRSGQPRLRSGGSVSFDGWTLKYLAVNDGDGLAAGAVDELWVWAEPPGGDGGAGDAPPLRHCRFRAGEVPPETSYIGRFDLGPLEPGTYRASIRLAEPDTPADRHPGGGGRGTGTVDLLFTVPSTGAEPRFLRWREGSLR